MNTKTPIPKDAPKPLLPLLKGSSTFKLVVPVSVEEKIRYLIRKFPSTEWSGVLFYSHKGSFEQGDLLLTCQDIFPMDLGTAGWTEFRMSEDVAAYMANNIELFDYEMGLVHSHHSMGAFFSGQDNKMLQQEGEDTNCFLSLVVDTKGTYVARLTRRVQTKSEITIRNLGKSYEFFGEGSHELAHDDTTTKTIDKEVIEYFDLLVERNEAPNPMEYLDTRFEDILHQKASSILSNYATSAPTPVDDDKGFFDFLHGKQAPPSSSTFERVSPPPTLFSEEAKNPQMGDVGMWQPNPKKIHEAVVHIITCNLILNPDKIDLKQWVTRHMVNVYKRIFGMDANSKATAFNEWMDFIIQFTIDYFDYSDAPDALMLDVDQLYGMVAQALMDEMFDLVGINDFVKAYYDTLADYIV